MVRRSWVPASLATFVLVGLLITPQSLAVPSGTGELGTLTKSQLGFLSHIDHIVFVVLENHAYDSEFGAYCLAVGPVCPHAANGVPAGTCVPETPTNITGPCVVPYNFTQAQWVIPDMYHNEQQAALAWDNGSMDGFYLHENATCLPCGTVEPFGHYNGTTVPTYWDLAQQFVLDDNFYSSVLDYSLPNHWHIVAGAAPQISLTYNPGNPKILNNSKESAQTIERNDHLYLNESNATRSVEDLLLNSSVSWAYYDAALSNYSDAIHIAVNANATVTSFGGAYQQWDPQAAKAESYNLSFVNHFAPASRFYHDAANGTIPALSWVIPPGLYSDHPPMNATAAQGWLASVVDAVERSPDWNTTAMFVSWDDYGGFWDHVAPPTWQGEQLGPRVPLLIISPWVDKGYIDPAGGFFESVLHLMEWRFGLGCLTTLDCTAPLPLGAFDWNRASPRAPVYFPTSIGAAAYPYRFTRWPGPGPYVPPPSFALDHSPDLD